MDSTERAAQIALILIAAVLVTAALDLAEAIFAPLTLALVAGVVLSPLSDFWEKRGFSPAFGAMVGLVATLVAVALLAAFFYPLVYRLIEQAPKVWADMQDVIESIREMRKGMAEVGENVAAAVATTDTPTVAAAAPEAAPAAEESVGIPSVTDAILAAPAILSKILIFAGALFFFLLTRSDIYSYVTIRLCPPAGRAALAKRLRRAERNVSRYFLTITVINAGLGVIVGTAFQLLGLPDAMIWGVVTFLVNYVVYLGPAIYIVVLAFVGVAEFDGFMAMAPAVTYVFLNSIEGQFVTPALVGKHLSVNPLLVFLALIFGLWLWGPIGGIVAIPLMLWVLVLIDAIKDREGASALATAA
ncbi:MAG: AI-2E family transporter [Pseudooceanicola sp.]|nr:AI-2E family transporter [Pseudooceanicola sp.]